MSTDATEPTPGTPAQGSAPEPTPAAPTSPPAEAAPATPEPEEKPGKEAFSQAADPAAVSKAFHEHYGLKGEFKSDNEFWDSVAELKRKIGERDEDAKIGKQLRGKEKELAALLEGQIVPEKFDTYDQYARALSQAAADDAPQALRQQVYDVQDRMSRALWELTQNRDGFISEAVQEALGDTLASKEDIDQRLSVDQQQRQFDQWVEGNRELLWKDGNSDAGLTAIGERTLALAQQDPELMAIPEGPARIRAAFRLATAELGRPKPTGKTNEHAKRQPPHAAGTPPSEEPMIDRFKKERESGRNPERRLAKLSREWWEGQQK